MDKAFGWVGEIFQALLRVIPWLVIVPATHGGIAFVHGHRVKEWKPGLHIYWPVVTTYKLIVTVRQTQRIQSKVVMTKDLKTVTVGALVTYYVDDVVSAIVKIADLPSDIIERSQGAVLAVVAESTIESIQADRVGFNKMLTERVGEVLNGYGVQILQASLTEFAPCTAYAINGHAALGNYSLWTGF
ncbi:MAG: SPFH domain-containing protein [Xanthobacteraceae bacterium]|nr:SPFH domain-containing protein [Xanthobacteraceae bacterium]QYK46267.1 MAG: SPFH domain-containing protein [Xanthobacteraceae bacterium]